MTYHERTSDRVSGLVIPDNIASSTDLNGPESDEIDITPTTAATSRIQKFSKYANIAPEITIRTAP